MIELKYLSKTFQMKDGAVKALQNINLTIPDGSIYGIIGMSGAGKSTLVRCINLLERPTGGSVVIDGVAMETLSPASLRKRRREITMIFQQFNLLMQRTCRIRPTPTRRSCPAVRSSASPLPAHWLPTPRCCCATRPPVRWTPTPPTPS